MKIMFFVNGNRALRTAAALGCYCLRLKFVIITVMKKIFLPVLFLTFFCPGAFCAPAERYVMFFAESADMPKAVAQKIFASNRFCLTAPFDRREQMSPEIEELVSLGKIEPSLALEPEPVLSLLASIYSAGAKGQRGFSDYIDDNFESFEAYSGRRSFGMFLSSSRVSHNILYYFAQKNLSWINVDNASEKIYGAYSVDGVTSFFLYKNFPYARKDVMKWLEARKENFIPVLLTKKHLANAELMSYVIDLFDKSAYIKPASPMFVSAERKNLIEENRTLQFESVQVKASVINKLCGAASFVNDYKNSGNFNGLFYSNALNELVYLCNYKLLRGLAANKAESERMFDAAYANIFRLLGAKAPSDAELKASSGDRAQNAEEENAPHASIAASGENGASITCDGIISGAEIYVKDNSTFVKIVFENGLWNDKAGYIDVYIDMNNFENAGSTAMLAGLKGFLAPDSAWEYALRITESRAFLYRHSASEKPVLAAEFPVVGCEVSIPQKLMRGNPVNWGYQIITVSKKEDGDKIIDFLNPSSQPKSDLLNQKPFQVAAVRLNR
jgi:hypothetical protein